MRPRIEHIAWSKVVPPGHRHDLADSAVATPDLAALGLPHAGPLRRDGPAQIVRLEEALAARIEAPARRVVVTAGTSEANACAFAGLLAPGDHVLVERPGYEPHRHVPPFFGAVVRTFERRRATEFGDVAAAVEAALTPVTRLVVVSDLHNPSGAPLADLDVERLHALAERHDFLVLVDETFRDSTPGPLATRARLGPRWVSTSSLTKSYGLGGLRIGWVAGDAAVLERCANAQNAMSGNPAHPSVALTLELLPHLDTLRARAHDLLAVNHATWRAFVAGAGAATPGFDCGIAPRGTTAWCRFADAGASEAFVAFASTRFEIAVTPGRFFGDDAGLRVGLGAEPERASAAIARLADALAAFHAESMPSGAHS